MHIAKYSNSKGDATRIIGHCRREKDKNGKYLKYKPKSDIHPERTHLNYNITFHKGEVTGHERLKKNLEETYMYTSKSIDNVVMCDCVLTLPKEYLGDPKVFFAHSAQFLYDQFGGEKSFVGAYVHNDETTPHMHFCFVPRVWDEKNERYKVCAKKCINKARLNSLHKDLGSYLHEKIGLDPKLINNGITKRTGGNKTTKELKQLEDEAKVLRDENKTLREENRAIREDNEILRKENKAFREENKALRKRVYRLRPLVKKLDGIIPESDEKELRETIERIEKIQIEKEINYDEIEKEFNRSRAREKERTR